MIKTQTGWPRPDLATIRYRGREAAASRLGGYGYSPWLEVGLLPALLYNQSLGEHNNHGHIDHVATQRFVATATGVGLDMIGRDYGMPRFPASYAAGSVTFAGDDGAAIRTGAILRRSDDRLYRVLTGATLSGGSVTVAVRPLQPGQDSNADSGTVLALQQPVPGLDTDGVVDAPGLTGGADREEDGPVLDRSLGHYRGRLWARKRSLNAGGCDSDWALWAGQARDVTRVWIAPYGAAGARVMIWVMMDGRPDGKPQGIPPYLPGGPTGDYADIVEVIRRYAPDRALPYVRTPEQIPMDVTVKNLRGDSPETRANIELGLRDLLLREASPPGVALDPPRPEIPAGTIPESWIRDVISDATGERAHSIQEPLVDLVTPSGCLLVPGQVYYV